MQKGKHQGGQTQGYPLRNYSAYPGNPENSRQFSREVPAFHASGTPGGGPGVRGMHHAPPTQPSTPPTSQDLKQPPAHLPSQAHQMPPQSGGQIMQYAMQGAGRGSTQQPQFYPSRAPPGSQRMAPHARSSVVMSTNAQSFMSQQVVQPVYQGHVSLTQMSGQGPMFVTPPMNQPFQIQQPRHQSSAFYSTQPILLPQPTVFTHYSQQPMYYTQSIQTMPRAGGPAPNSQGVAPAQPQTPLTLIAGHSGTMISTPGVSHQVKTTRPKKKLEIIDPSNGRNVLEDMNNNDNTSSRSGESSARQTPQPPVTIINPDTGRDVINDFKNENSSTKFQGSSERIYPSFNAGQKTDQGLAADFATRVAIAARGDHSGSPNSPALQQSSSRTSNYSESESQASPDPQGMSTPSVSPSKLDTSVESISSESPIVENNITYDTNQQAPLLQSGWGPVLGGGLPVEMLPISIHSNMMLTDDIMRTGPLPNQSAREYQAVQPPWMSEGTPVSVVISKDPGTQAESSIRPGPERVTPVVSALTQGPTVEIEPRPQREQFPALGKGHQQQSPAKRKQRSEQTQEQGEGKIKDQQFKPKSVTPSVENKKHSPQPSQESDENVQFVQAKNNEPKTIIIKKNDSDNSGTKTKSNDSVKNKESNNVEARIETTNLNEEVVEDFHPDKSENVKCEVSAPKETSPTLASEEPVEKNVVEEVRENTSIAVSESEVPLTSAECKIPIKTNGESAEEDAKSNNQKSKPGNKRPAQSKMRLEAKDSRTTEPETPAIEVTPSAPSVPETKNSEPSTMVANEKPDKEEPIANEEKEKEDLLVATKNEENAKQTTSLKVNEAPAVPNKIVLKHTYEVDQWSPLNPDGKKKYDRQFIISLQNEPHSRRKPANFPNLELLNDNNKQRTFDRNSINSMNRSHVDVLYPSFANKNSSQRGGQAITKRGSQQGKPKPAKPAVVQVSLLQDVKLHETENAWKPTRITEPNNRTEEEAKTEALYKRVRGILNKLTPEKLDRLVAQVRTLPIDSPARLEGVIDLVFKKAVDEPSFSVAYAQMCSTLQKIEVPSDRGSGKPESENFKKLLLGKCQQEFEKNTAAELKRDERLKEIDQEKDPDKKKMLQLAFEEEERRIRMRSVGNIRFIGELYKMNMLTCGIMHSCINQLLSQGDEESLECLCKLLTTIGEGLENKEITSKAISDKGKGERKSLNPYFKKLSDIVKEKGSGKISSRVRFMIQDLIDLRCNKWVPRRVESQPKPIDQIQKEVERENIELSLALHSPQEKNKRQDIRNLIDNRKRGPDSSGWTTVMGSQQNKSKYVIESSKLKLDQSDVEVASTVSLGSRNQFIWNPNASSGKSDDKRSMSQLSANKFAVLSSTSSGNSSLKGTSYADKDKINSYKALDDEVRSSKSSSQQDSRSSSRESASSKRDDSRFVTSANKTQLPSAPPPVSREEISEKEFEEIKKNSKRILEDYLMCFDVNEAEKDLEDLLSPSRMKDFVSVILNEAMDKRGSSPKRAVGVLMNHFITKKKISKEQFLVGLSKVLETTDDLTLDMPFLWEYLAEILVDMCAEEVITFKDLASAVDPIRGSPGSEKFLAALVKVLIGEKNIKWVENRWKESKVKLSDIIDKKEIINFVKQNKLEFMAEKVDVEESVVDKRIESELSRLITSKASFDEITAWVSENVGEKSSEPSFLRTLMTVLLEASVTSQSSSYKLDTEFLSHYEPLIHRYTGHAEKLELPCLFAVQAFMHKLEYPHGILHNIFNHLWDDNLISLESFKKWRSSESPHEQEGHAVCVKSLTSFFTHLNETETDEES